MNTDSQPTRIFKSALECQKAFDCLADGKDAGKLKRLLDRWKELGFPKPDFDILNKSFPEWSPEFERFLDRKFIQRNYRTELPARITPVAHDNPKNMSEEPSKQISESGASVSSSELVLRDFQPGDIISHKSSLEGYIVTANYGSYAIAVRTQHISNPSEWNIVQKAKAQNKCRCSQ